jgi:cytochrome c556
MNDLSRKFALLGVAFALVFVASCGQPGGGADAVDDSPEATAFRARQGLMRMIAWKVGQLRGMEQGDVPVDNAVFTESSVDVAALANMLTDAFIPGSDVEGSAALPEIWSNRDDFDQKAADFMTAAEALAAAAQSGGYDAGQSLVQGVGQTCGACHRSYRRRDE